MEDLIKAIHEKVEKDIENLSYEELDGKYFNHKFHSKTMVDSYLKKYNITAKPEAEKSKVPKTKYERKKPAKILSGEREYCSYGTNLWANAKQIQYKYYNESNLENKSYKDFLVKFGAHWKSLSDDDKLKVVQDEIKVSEIYK